MILTPVSNYFERANYRPSSPHKYSNLCEEKLGIKDSLRNVTILLLISNFIFLIGMCFLCFFNFIVQTVLISVECWCIYMIFYKKINPTIMKFFIFEQLTNNVYAIFSIIIIIAVKTNFGYDFFNYHNKEIIFTTSDKLIIISSVIIICCKIFLTNFYKNIYKLLVWHQEHVNKMIEIHKNSVTQGNNNHLNSPPKHLVIPEVKKGTKSERLSPIQECSDKLEEMSVSQKSSLRKLSKVSPKLSLQVTPTSFKDYSSPATPYDINYSSDFYLVPLNTPFNFDVKLSLFDEEEKQNDEEKENKIDIEKNSEERKKSDVLRRYFISLSDVSTVDNNNYYIDKFNNSLQQNDLKWM
ncbi:Hypothetical protein SRAE_1000107200 [Strongyloides ratti]|uniref:Transmembrane protein n=1 Tax=Strongyloides ratti TaxID=34506 RepID=A0A090MVC0_STRRB|nr:Hypothetical protein SRAE_1000107200 [Strongyloides ratti]CEF62803.1 Hypothetical protein SRAE_1000107200 [Strongyloides ratti]